MRAPQHIGDMESKTDWHSRVAICARWLLGGGLLLGLTVGAMTLSTDGARLKRLFSGKQPAPPEGDILELASYEPAPANLHSNSSSGPTAAAQEAPQGGSKTEPLETPETSPDPELRGGCVMAEVLGSSGAIKVLLDGQWIGTAPALISEVDPGMHRLTFQRGTVTWEEQVRVSAGDTTIIACVAPDEIIPAERKAGSRRK